MKGYGERYNLCVSRLTSIVLYLYVLLFLHLINVHNTAASLRLVFSVFGVTPYAVKNKSREMT